MKLTGAGNPRSTSLELATVWSRQPMQLPLPTMAVASVVAKSAPQKVGSWAITPTGLSFQQVDS